MGEQRISDEIIAKYLKKEQREKKSGKRLFVIYVIVFLIAMAVFTGGAKYALAIGAILIVMIICAHFLTREFW